MASEDYDGKLVSRAELVARREDIENWISGIKSYFEPEEMKFFLGEESQKKYEEYEQLKIRLLLKDISISLQGLLIKEVDLNSSMMSEQTHSSNSKALKNLEHIQVAISRNLPIYTTEEMISIL